MGTLSSNVEFMRLLFGRFATNSGDSLYFIGAMWLVYELTGSSLYTGVAGFLLTGPNAFQFLFGPLVDRWNLRRILVGTQLVQGAAVLLLPVAVFFDFLSVWIVLAVVPVLSLLNQFVYPAQSTALPQLVDETELVRANSLFSLAYQGTEMVFNAVGGLLIVLVSVSMLFVINSVVFFVAAFLFAGVTLRNPTEPEDESRSEDSYLESLATGFDYISGSVILWMIVGAMVTNFGYGAVLAVLPAFADSLGGPGMYGFLMAAIAGGSLAGALAASAVEDRSYGLISVAGFVFAGLSLSAAILSPAVPLTVAFVFLTAVPIGVYNVMFLSMIQSSVDEALLGRIVSAVDSIASAMTPVGTVFGGVVADIYGPAAMLWLFAGLLVLFGFYFLAHPHLRSLPSVTAADEAVLGLQ